MPNSQALALVGSRDDALDLSQEAFARGFRARHTLDPDHPFYAWLYQILRRLCFNFLQYPKLMAESREQALDRMIASAKGLGANGIINVRFTTSYIMNNASEILAYGDAVVPEREAGPPL